MIIICLVVIFDLFKFGIHHNPIISPNIWLAKPKTVEFLEKDKGFHRIHIFGADQSWQMVYLLSNGWKQDLNYYVNHREVLQPSFNMIYHIKTSDGCPDFVPKRFNEIFYFFYHPTNVIAYKHKKYKLVGLAIPNFEFTRLLSALNIKYILSFFEMRTTVFKEVLNIDFEENMPSVRVYENKDVMPRSYVVPKVKVVKDEDKILDELTSPEFKSTKYVIIEEDIDFSGSESVEGSKVEITKYSPLEVIIEANLTNSGFLVLADTFYPGWKVFIDGKEDKIYRANYIQRTVLLEKGKHIVKFIYEPASFKIGALISIITIFLVLAFGLISRFSGLSR